MFTSRLKISATTAWFRGDLNQWSGAQPAPRGWWACILGVALVLWIVRVPVVTTLFGWVLLGATPQAQDLFHEFLDLSPWTLLRMFWFQLVLTMVWAIPTHYAARMLVNTDPRRPASDMAPCLKGAAMWVPRLLGLLTFLAVEFAIWRSYESMPTLDQSDVKERAEHALMAMALLVAAGAVAYSVWVSKRPRNFRPTGLLGHLNARLGGFWQAISPGRVPGSPDEEGRDIGRFILISVFAIFLGIFLGGADHIGALFPRAMAVPFILGGSLPFLSYVSGVGRQTRAPLITGLFALIAVLAATLGDNHSVRRVASKSLPPMLVEDAVDLWMRENRCNPKAPNAVMTCPRPIIVAAAGGASRAGFMTASIIGYFLQPWDAAQHGLSIKDVRNRIFAISSVSGGSMGAVMVTAALSAGHPDNDHPPCVQGPVDQWWGANINFWRDCFEALTSGDFLTADFLGFAFNDMLPFALRDRAAVLEDSWRNRFNEVVPAAHNTAEVRCQGLDCPFLSLRPRSGHWIPLLVLNGTSETTGGRILTTPLAMTYTPRAKCPTAVASGTCPLFVEADSFHDLLNTTVTRARWGDQLGFLERYLLRGTEGADVRVSTAAHNSARFPFISPSGSVRNKKISLSTASSTAVTSRLRCACRQGVGLGRARRRTPTQAAGSCRFERSGGCARSGRRRQARSTRPPAAARGGKRIADRSKRSDQDLRECAHRPWCVGRRPAVDNAPRRHSGLQSPCDPGADLAGWRQATIDELVEVAAGATPDPPPDRTRPELPSRTRCRQKSEWSASGGHLAGNAGSKLRAPKRNPDREMKK